MFLGLGLYGFRVLMEHPTAQDGHVLTLYWGPWYHLIKHYSPQPVAINEGPQQTELILFVLIYGPPDPKPQTNPCYDQQVLRLGRSSHRHGSARGARRQLGRKPQMSHATLTYGLSYG